MIETMALNPSETERKTNQRARHPLHRLWRGPHLHKNHPEVEAKETWLELFYDLVYVAVLIQLGNVLSDNVSWHGAARFALLFAPLWWAWSNFAFYMNRFVIDDVWHRLIVMSQIFCIAWLGSSLGGAFEGESTQFVLLYIALRVTIIILYLRTFSVSESRAMTTRYITDYHLVAIVLWSASLGLGPEWRWTLWLGTLLWEMFNSQRPVFRRFHKQFPLNGEHMRERFGTLTLLVLGESFIKSITSEDSLQLTWDAFLFSAPGIAVLFSLWWLYFEDTNAVYEDKQTANPALWLYTHLPLSLALTAFGVAVTKLLESTYDQYLSPNYAFMYCLSLIIYCLALAVLNAWADRQTGNERALVRLGAAAVLGLAFWLGERSLDDNANALFFVSVAFGVFVLQVAHDLWLARRYPQIDDEVGELMP